jgi:hypothetical protein
MTETSVLYSMNAKSQSRAGNNCPSLRLYVFAFITKTLATLIFLFLFIPSYSQTNYQLDVRDQSLESVLQDLENRYDLRFSYANAHVENLRVTVKTTQTELAPFLQTVFQGTGLECQILSANYIVLKKNSNPTPTLTPTPKPTSPLTLLCGTILDSATAQPVPYANAYLLRNRRGRTADQSGEFSFQVQLQRQDTLVISSLGYARQYLPVADLLGKPCLTISLRAVGFGAESILIAEYMTDGIDLADNGAATLLRPDRVNALPGQAEPDVLRTIQFLPGINAPDGAASSIYIRGGTPDQNLIMWEGIPIYHSAHYFGMISAFNPYVIDRAKVYRGGFGAEYGGRISGVIDMSSADHRLVGSDFGAGVNLLHAFTQGKVSLGDGKASVVYSLRRSIADLWRSPAFASITERNLQGILLGKSPLNNLPANLTLEDSFVFLDSHVKTSVQVSPKDEVALAWFYGRSDFEAQITDQNREQVQADLLGLRNMGGSLNWQHQWRPGIQSELLVLRSTYQHDYSYDLRSLVPNSQFAKRGVKNNQIDEAQFHLQNRYLTEAGHELSLGYQLVDYDVDYLISQKANEASLADENVSFRSRLHALHLGLKTAEAKRWGLNLGFRGSWYEQTQQAYFAPRIQLWYKILDGLSLHAHAGKYYQFLSQLIEFRGDNAGIETPIWVLAGDEVVPVLRANQYQLGLLYHQKSWIVDLQVYRKRIDDLTSLSIGFEAGPGNRYHLGTGMVRGLDLLVKKRWHNYKTWLSYSISQVTYLFPGFFDPVFPAPFDQRHVLHWAHLFKYKGWEASLGFKLATGRPYALMDDFQVLTNPMGKEQIRPVFDEYNGERLPWQHQLDVSLLYRLNPEAVSRPRAVLGISLFNVYNQENIYSREYFVDMGRNRPRQIDFIDRMHLGFTPNAVLRLEW